MLDVPSSLSFHFYFSIMFKDFIIVGLGSFIGGGLRLLVSRGLSAVWVNSFPMGTFAVNVLGCLLIGFFSSLPATGNWPSPSTRLLLTTGFCGGFTTFSTLMSENASLLREGRPEIMAAYLVLSLVVGLLAVWGGQALARMIG